MSKPIIEWCGEILADIGYGIHARRILKQLYDSGMQIKLIPYEHYVPENRKVTDPFWIMKVAESNTLPEAPIRINCCIPPIAQMKPNGKNILYFMWETNRLPVNWGAAIQKADQVWTGCEMTTKLAKGYNKNSITIRPPPSLLVPKPIELEGISNDTILFTYIGLWIPRKNMEDLLTAFTCAFSNVSDVALLIKTWGADNSSGFKTTVAQRIREHTNSHLGINKPKITVINEILPEQQIQNILGRTDVYVSPSKGEGFDLPLTDSLALNKLAVINRFGAHEDYLDNSDQIIEYNHSIRPVVAAMIPNYEAYQMWAQPDINHMMESMITAYKRAKQRRKEEMIPVKKDNSSKLADQIKEEIAKLI